MIDAEAILKDYMKPGFVRRLRGFIPKNCSQVLVQLTETILRDKLCIDSEGYHQV